MTTCTHRDTTTHHARASSERDDLLWDDLGVSAWTDTDPSVLRVPTACLLSLRSVGGGSAAPCGLFFCGQPLVQTPGSAGRLRRRPVYLTKPDPKWRLFYTPGRDFGSRLGAGLHGGNGEIGLVSVI